jgi:glutamate transport system permease protein
VGDLLSQFNILGAFLVTIKLAALTAVFSLLIGTALAVMRISPIASLRAFGAGYVNIFRNTPLTLIIVGANLGLYVQLGLRLAPDASPNFTVDQNFRLAVLGLSVYHASFVCEAVRSGFNTIPAGQVEAARAIGLSFGSTLRLVVLPQAIRSAVAPLGNVMVALTKNTTVAAVIGVAEAAAVMKQMIELRPDVLPVIFLLMASGFVILTLPVGLLFTWLSRRLAVAR